MPAAHQLLPISVLFPQCRSFDFDPEDDSLLRDWRRMQLPHGTWHHNLTRLELPHAILAAPAVLAALQACTQLEELTVGRFSLPPWQPLPEALHFVAWAGALPRLTRLTVGLSEGWSEVPPGMPRQYERSSRQGDTWSTDIEPAECMLQRQGLAAMGALRWRLRHAGRASQSVLSAMRSCTPMGRRASGWPAPADVELL